MGLSVPTDCKAINSLWSKGPCFGSDLELGQWFDDDNWCRAASRFYVYERPPNEGIVMGSIGFLTTTKFIVDEVEVFGLKLPKS